MLCSLPLTTFCFLPLTMLCSLPQAQAMLRSLPLTSTCAFCPSG
jgi:hypothetical protein